MAFIDVFTEEDCIKNAVDSLLSYLYKPDPARCWCADGRKLKKFGLEGEAINWGDLYCADVEKFANGPFLVTVEEAAPGCTNLCRWIQDWLGKWGWNARVQTEW
jgi:hypothetical protein